MADNDALQQFIETTGADANVAKFFIESAKGDLERALDSFFENGGEVPDGANGQAPMGDDDDEDDMDDGLDEDELTRAEAGASSGPATLDEMFKRAEKVNPEDLLKQQNDPKRSIFKGKGFALGNEAEVESEMVESGPARPAAKSYKVTIWRGGAFQVDDGEVRYPDRGPDQEKNKRFMDDLVKQLIPEEMRERDATGQPVPVNISLADHREEDPSNATVVKPKFKAFGGGGNLLGKDWTQEAFNKVAAAADAPAGAGGSAASNAAQSKEELASQLKEFASDSSAADATSVQLRLPSGQRAEARLSAARSVAELRRFIIASGYVAPGQSFIMSAGFPPKPLAEEGATLQNASLCNAAVMVRLV